MSDTADLAKALTDFFTSTVALKSAPTGLSTRSVWWQRRGKWLYPWRIVGYSNGIAQGYPCGEPKRL